MAGKYIAHTSSAPVLSTELNSLADGGNKITGTARSNDAATTERDFFGNFQLDLAATSTRTGTDVDLYILPEVDGNFVSGGDSLDPESEYYQGSFTFDLATTARIAERRGVPLPNSDYHVLLINNLGVAFASSGTTLKLEIDSYEDA